MGSLVTCRNKFSIPPHSSTGNAEFRTFLQGVFRLCSIESPNRDMRLLAKPSWWSPVMRHAHVVPLVSVASVPVVVMASAHGPTAAMIPLAMGIVAASTTPSKSTASSKLAIGLWLSCSHQTEVRLDQRIPGGLWLPVITCCTHSHTTVLWKGKVLLQVQAFIRHFCRWRKRVSGNRDEGGQGLGTSGPHQPKGLKLGLTRALLHQARLRSSLHSSGNRHF